MYDMSSVWKILWDYVYFKLERYAKQKPSGRVYFSRGWIDANEF